MAIFNGKKANETELGFGSKNYKDSVRFLNSDGTVNVRRTGMGMANLDPYHWLTTISFKKFIFIIIGFYTTVNLFFASVYFTLCYNSFGGLESSRGLGRFLDLVYFSSQTITTVGYGHVYPKEHLASLIASLQSLFGLMLFAIVTGVLFGRFSRPKNSLLYSKNILLAPYKDMTALMFRVANTKQYELIENEANVVMTMNNPATNKREFFNLTLELEKINFLALTWTVVHPIDEKSPLNGLNITDLQERDAEIIILIKGITDTFSQTVFSRHSYKASQFLDKRKFVPVKQDVNEKGRVIISLEDIHVFESA
ncbi:MAG: ion channel [Bacteroidota bacterium]|nr:ion channel [Bacteroidota bacterium]